MNSLYRVSLLACCLSISIIGAFAQTKNRVSPLAVDSFAYRSTYVKIVYSQPHKKGREIFGGLVPYGKVWRTGANESTELTTSKDIMVNDKRLTAGTYSLFTIPEKEKWTIILSSEVGLWGSYNYNPKKDVMRFEVPVQQTMKPYEDFTIEFKEKNNQADVMLSWDRTRVSFVIQCIE